MSNRVLSGLGFNKQVRFYIVDSTKLIRTVAKKNDASPLGALALGKSVSITGLMGLMLKGEEEITSIIEGDGPLGKIISIANAKGETRATVTNPYVGLAKEEQNLTLANAVGEIGNIKVIKNLKLKEPFVSETSIITGDISPDFTYYFSYSEQTPTAISSSIIFDEELKVQSGGALIVQLLPNASNQIAKKLEEKVRELPSIAGLLKEMKLEQVLDVLFADDYLVLAENNLTYHCECSEERFINSLKLLPTSEIIVIKKEQVTECVCNFCKEKYIIDTNKL